MKQLRATITAAQTHAAVRATWRTDIFRASHDDPHGWVRRVVDDLARLPRLWCELSDPTIERSHFYAWLGVLPHRHEYANPAISDLYYLHEYLHCGQMPYAPLDDHAAWADKIWINERDASLGSEVYVYFELPQLRAQTFDFEIWADRYLSDPDVMARHRDDPESFVRWFCDERERAMTAPKAGDVNEALIASYHRLNVAWAEIWKDAAPRVEDALATFVRDAPADPESATRTLQAWLQREKGDGVCPFEAQARQFADVVAQARDC